MIKTRALTEGEVAELISWAGNEGWNPGLGDAEAFRVADPEGFIGAFDGDRLAAGISVVRYGADFGFLGLFISHPDYRGKGYGKAVWAAGMAHLEGRTIGLDGVPDLQPYYQSVGFVIRHETVRYSGRPVSGTPAETSDGIALDDALKWDHTCFPAPRAAFLANWLRPPHVVRALGPRGAVKGYGVARRCGTGNKIGPLFAKDADAAFAVLCAVSDAVSGMVIVDVPADQTAFVAKLEAAGMTPSFSTARMYKGAAPKVAEDKVFGLTSLELG